jgi:Ca2+-binding EF-hand superfamily protein
MAQAPTTAPGSPQVQHGLGHSGWAGREHGAVPTRAALAQHVQALFAKLDSNRDGSITKAEADAAKGKMHERMEQRIEHRADRNGGDRRAIFDRIDANRDGTISRAEFEAAPTREERRIVIRDGNGADGGERGMHGMHGMRGGGMGGLHGALFEMADANRDGRVTLQEATAAAYRHFDSADANRDGQISPDERRQMHQRMRSERRPG